MAVSAPTSGFVDPSGLSFEPPGSAMPPAGLLGMMPSPTLGPSSLPAGLMSAGMGGLPPVFPGTSGPHMPPPIPPELVSDPSFPGGYAFETMDMMTGDMARSPVDWGSLKSIGESSPYEAGAGYGMGALMLGHGGEIWRNMSDSMDPTWHAVGSLYDTSVWSDPDLTGGSMAASLPAYTAPATSPFGSGGMYGPDPMAAMKFAMPPASLMSALRGVPTGPPPPSMAAPLATPVVTPVAAPLAPPLAPPAPVAPMPTPMPAPMPIASPPRMAAAVSKPPTRMRGGAGPYLGCDPITGKCPPYR